MTNQPLWQLSIVIAAEAEEAVSSLAAELFGQPPVVYSNFETSTTRVSIFLRKRPDDALRSALRCDLKAIASYGVAVGPARVALRRLKPQDWAESWKRHFRPIEFGPRLLLKPGWSRRKPRAGQAVVVLDPGLSFGTGNHPTTAFCLREIVAARITARPKSLLDLGTGSGIVAIAAAKLGYRPVRAIDIDPAAVKVARANAARNRVSRLIQFAVGPVAALKLRRAEQFDVVCANLMFDLLMAERNRIARQVSPQGLLVLAGILRKEFPALQRAYENAGFRLISSKRGGEWKSGAFSRRGG